MKIWSKINDLAWGHYFPIISLREIFQTLKAPNSDLTEIQTRPRFYAYPHYLQVWKRSDHIQQRKGGDIVFPIINQWAFSVAMETTVLIQSVPKPYAAFPPP